MLLKKRITATPNIKNFKNLKFIYNIRTHYSIGEILGEGAYGRVYSAVKLRTRKKYAIKMISKSKMRDEEVP